jgi:hypothetical protein
MQFYYRKISFINKLMKFDKIVYMKTDSYDPEDKYLNTGRCPVGPAGLTGIMYDDHGPNGRHLYTYTLVPYGASNGYKRNITPKYQKYPKVNNRSKAMMRANRRR